MKLGLAGSVHPDPNIGGWGGCWALLYLASARSRHNVGFERKVKLRMH